MPKTPVLKLYELIKYGYELRFPPSFRLYKLGLVIKDKYPPLSIVHNLEKLSYTFKDIAPYISQLYAEDSQNVVMTYLMKENKDAKHYGFPYEWLYESIVSLSKDEDWSDS